MAEIIDAVCKRCWGKRFEVLARGSVGETIQCRRCKGTGEEPDYFNWPATILMVVIFLIGLYMVWSLPQ